MIDKNILENIVGKDNIKLNEPMSKHTTFRIGGSADCFVSPEYAEDVVEVVNCLRDAGEEYFILGNGSNLLVSDNGYRGTMVNMCVPGRKTAENSEKISLSGIYTMDDKKVQSKIKDIEKYKEKTVIVAGAGVMLSVLANYVIKEGLAGFEFAGGIPGSLGGAVTMNAGAYGGEIKDCIIGAMVLGEDGTEKYLDTEALELGYRSSIIQKKNYVVLWAAFAFEKGDSEESLKMMQEFNKRRREKQPLEYGSAGSTFKRPEGYFAGKLIEDSGLKGYGVGDVMVSDKHCGFVVNKGNGTYKEARQVIEHVQNTVLDKYGVKLELEVKIID